MATTVTCSGSLSIALALQAAFTVDTGGARTSTYSHSRTFAGTQALPIIGITGWLTGTLTCAAGDILLAHATDPFQAMGDSVYSDGFTVASKKLKFLALENLDSTNSITIVRKTTNGLPIFSAATAGLTLSPGGVFYWQDPSGNVIGALTTGSNDALTISVSGGSPQMRLVAGYE